MDCETEMENRIETLVQSTALDRPHLPLGSFKRRDVSCEGEANNDDGRRYGDDRLSSSER